MEFDLEHSSKDDLRVLSSDRIEQSALPTCMTWSVVSLLLTKVLAAIISIPEVIQQQQQQQQQQPQHLSTIFSFAPLLGILLSPRRVS